MIFQSRWTFKQRPKPSHLRRRARHEAARVLATANVAENGDTAVKAVQSASNRKYVAVQAVPVPLSAVDVAVQAVTPRPQSSVKASQAVLPPPPQQVRDVAVQAALPQHVPAVPRVQPPGPLQHRPTHRLALDVHPVQLGLNTRTD